MRPLVGVLILLSLAVPFVEAQGTGPVPTRILVTGDDVANLTVNGTRSVPLSVELSAGPGFTCTQDATLAVDVTVNATGPLTATLDNRTLSFTVEAAHSPLSTYTAKAVTTLTLTRNASRENASALVTATFPGGAVSGCAPSTWAPAEVEFTVRATPLPPEEPAPAPVGPRPTIRILTPANNSTGAEFEMRVEVTSFRLKAPGGAAAAGEGHVHYLVDGRSAEGVYATPNATFSYRGLAPGLRTLRAELHNNDHTPLEPPVFAEVQVLVVSGGSGGAPANTTTPAGGTPTTNGAAPEEDSLLPGPGLATLGFAALAAALLLRRRG